MRTLKPWTVCANLCEQALERHLEVIGQPLQIQNVAHWVGSRTFRELLDCDIAAHTLVATLELPLRVRSERTMDSILLAWELALRLQFAVDVCRRYVGLRRYVPWTSDPKKNMEELLISQWRQNALCWAYRRYGQ